MGSLEPTSTYRIDLTPFASPPRSRFHLDAPLCPGVEDAPWPTHRRAPPRARVVEKSDCAFLLALTRGKDDTIDDPTHDSIRDADVAG